MRDDDFERGAALYQRFVRGDALIGLVADVPAMEAEMLAALWAAATAGNADAWALLGDSYLAALKPQGAFGGVDPDDADARPWPAEVAEIVDDEPALAAALRGYAQAARLGRRAAVMQFARMARHSSADNQRRAHAMLVALTDPSAAELYQRGLVENWLGDVATSARTHHAAAERGDLDAQFELSLYYAQGLGVDADAAQAAAWLRRAADGGHGRALYNLGAAYARGDHGAPDMAEAAAYYRRAAAAGNGRAAAMLGVMVLSGDLAGTAADARRWLDDADAAGFASWELLAAVGLDDPRADD